MSRASARGTSTSVRREGGADVDLPRADLTGAGRSLSPVYCCEVAIAEMRVVGPGIRGMERRIMHT